MGMRFVVISPVKSNCFIMIRSSLSVAGSIMRDALTNIAISKGQFMPSASYHEYKIVWSNGRKVKNCLVEARNLAHACRIAYAFYGHQKFWLIGGYESGTDNCPEPYSITQLRSAGHSKWLERMFEAE